MYPQKPRIQIDIPVPHRTAKHAQKRKNSHFSALCGRFRIVSESQLVPRRGSGTQRTTLKTHWFHNDMKLANPGLYHKPMLKCTKQAVYHTRPKALRSAFLVSPLPCLKDHKKHEMELTRRFRSAYSARSLQLHPAPRWRPSLNILAI